MVLSHNAVISEAQGIFHHATVTRAELEKRAETAGVFEGQVRMRIGHIYEVEPRIKFVINGVNTGAPKFLRLIGFASNSHPVFQDGEKFYACDPAWTSITPIDTTSPNE